MHIFLCLGSSVLGTPQQTHPCTAPHISTQWLWRMDGMQRALFSLWVFKECLALIKTNKQTKTNLLFQQIYFKKFIKFKFRIQDLFACCHSALKDIVVQGTYCMCVINIRAYNIKVFALLCLGPFYYTSYIRPLKYVK